MDSLDLFKELSHNQYLQGTDFVLFLNKYDLFIDKIKTSDLKACFPDYEGNERSIRFSGTMSHHANRN